MYFAKGAFKLFSVVLMFFYSSLVFADGTPSYPNMVKDLIKGKTALSGQELLQLPEEAYPYLSRHLEREPNTIRFVEVPTIKQFSAQQDFLVNYILTGLWRSTQIHTLALPAMTDGNYQSLSRLIRDNKNIKKIQLSGRLKRQDFFALRRAVQRNRSLAVIDISRCRYNVDEFGGREKLQHYFARYNDDLKIVL